MSLEPESNKPRSSFFWEGIVIEGEGISGKPGNSNALRAVQMDAHFAVSLQIQHLRCTSARRMLASVQKWQEGISVALTDR